MGSTDKHLYVVVDDLYEELQNENGPLVAQWTEESIRAWTRELGEKTSIYQMSEHAEKALKRTRLATDPCSRCSKTSKYFARQLTPTFELVKRQFKEWDGPAEGLTLGMEFSARTIWFDIVLITQKPYALLAIRLEEVGPRREFPKTDPLPEIIQQLYSKNQNR